MLKLVYFLNFIFFKNSDIRNNWNDESNEKNCDAPISRGSVDYPSTRGILVNVG